MKGKALTSARARTICALASMLAVAGCSGATSGPSSASSQGSEEITWGITYTVVSLDPGIVYDSAGNNYVTFTICDPLLRYGSDLSLKPGIAASYTQTSPTTYAYKLRPEAKFWDGNPVTPEDVAFSINRILDPALASPLASLVGAANLKGATVTGPDEVTLETTKPNPIAQWLAATPVGQVVEKSFAEKAGGDFGTAADKVMCSGPYKPVSYVKGDSTVVEAVDGYWDESNKPKIQKVTFREVPNTADLVAALRSGEVDGTFDITARDARALSSDKGLSVYVGPGSYINYLAPNFRKGPFANVDVRKALSMALDRKGLAAALDGPDGLPLRGPILPGMDTYEKEKFAAADAALPVSSSPQTAEAKALLEKSGFAGATVKIIFLSGSVGDTIAAALQSAGKDIGLNVEVVKATSAEFFAEAWSGKYPRTYDAISIFFAPDIPDPSGLLIPPYGSEFANQQGWSSEEFDAIREEWGTAKNGSPEQADALIRMEQLIVREQVNIPLNIQPLVVVTRSWMSGYTPTPLYYYQPFLVSMGQ